jgi:hypothetical protein
MNVFCLKPIKPDHESWPASRVGSKIEWVKIWASSEDDARYKVARATDVPESELPQKPAKHKYAKISYWPSPWELDYVTSCNVDTSKPLPGNHILLSDCRTL